VPPPPPGAAVPPPLPDADGAAAGEEMGGQLHPAAIGVWSTTQAGALILIFVINPASVLFALPFIALVAVASVVRWSRFRWRIAGGTLVIEQGLIRRERRVIPLERIQSVDLVRRVTHRLFGVVAVQVEAIGGGGTEGQLDALSPKQAERLRHALLAGRAAARGGAGPPAEEQVEEPAGELLVRVPPKRLVLAGLTEVNGTLIAGLFGLVWQLFGDRVDELIEFLPELLASNVALVASVAAVLLAVVLLVAAQLLAFWHFTLHRAGGELRVRRGLLEQRFDTVPLRRVQSLRIEENLPRRLLGFAAVKADVAGKPGGGSGGTDTLLPFGTAEEARALVEEVLGREGAAHTELTRMPTRARSRRLVRAVIPVVVLALAVAMAVDPWGLALLLLLVPAVATASASYRALGHAELPGVLVTRSGWWVRRTAFVPTTRLQTMAVTQSVFQRWRSLATLQLGIARSPGLWGGPQMIDLDHDVAFGIAGDLAPVMAAARRPSDLPTAQLVGPARGVAPAG
jgi:putative membrane protein